MGFLGCFSTLAFLRGFLVMSLGSVSIFLVICREIMFLATLGSEINELRALKILPSFVKTENTVKSPESFIVDVESGS
ncbi:unnamed protein product [marine sediment metagenome]|uniref:Uncharacterized protein n=1 Tax=marine sediment metagenome TaxID=412755 RepID=X1SZK8_9ZZZZ